MKPTSNRIQHALKVSVALLLLYVTAAGAQSPGTFTETSQMTTPRQGHSATLLHNGKILIAGGSMDLSGSRTASAELYDPAEGTFAPTGGMTTLRAWHTATLLPDGRVLIAGGDRSVSAELYDPSTGTFTATGNMITPQACPTATLLGNGKVVTTGGGAELFDPSTGTFGTAGTFANGKVWGACFPATSTLLPDGRVLLTWEGHTELYDPVASKFSFTGATPWTPATATLLMNGKVLFAGSEPDMGAVANGSAVYDPASGTVAPTINKARDRDVPTATLLPDGTVLITGGGVYTTLLASTDLYSPATNTLIPAGDMTTGRKGHSATLLPNGSVLLAGGYSYGKVITRSAELYKPSLLMAAPMLFSVSGSGQRQGAILHPGTPQFASASNPAVIGEALEIYCTGLVEGSVIPPQIAIGGRMAEILFFGQAPGWPGLNQVNIRVPTGVAPGPAVTVRLTHLNRPSNDVTIGVR